MSQLSDADYLALKRLIQATIARVKNDDISSDEAQSVLMSFLASWSDGNLFGFADRIEAMISRWTISDLALGVPTRASDHEEHRVLKVVCKKS